ncbi:MAG: hypothetical protein NTY66_01395 [Candidatus Vogelbacteria bacterium]|nr:hypothetical protein [Candidatus Vogelbacteria bacterium]
MKITLPPFVKPFLWSYDVENLDEKDKKRVITNVLNLGTKEATDWLLAEFDREEINEAIKNPYRGEWDKKSLNFWSLIFDVRPN